MGENYALDVPKEEHPGRDEEKQKLLLQLLFAREKSSDDEYLAYRFLSQAVFYEQGVLQNGEALLLDAKEKYPRFFKPEVSLTSPALYQKETVSPGEKPKLSYQERVALYERDRETYQNYFQR